MKHNHGLFSMGWLKSLPFLFPAVITAILIFVTLPMTTPVLAEVPARLETQSAEGNYPDGVYVGSSRGYGGSIEVQVTVEGGQIVDVIILSASGETPAYLRRAERIIDQVCLNQTWEVDTISGATYTCKGVLGAIQNAITGEIVINEAPPSSEPVPVIQESFTEPAAYLDGVYTGSAHGFGGMITVSVTISGGKLTDLQVIDASAETPSYLRQAMTVVSRILNAGSPNVDTVSGATYTSNGIINATKLALKQAAVDAPPEEEEPEGPAMDPSVMPAEALKDGVYTGVGEGYGGDIVVQVTVENGRIHTIEIISAEEETPSYFERAKTLVPYIISTQSTQVDTISGATLSSEGILEAVEDALSQAKENPDASGETEEEEQPATPPEEEETTLPHYADGVYSATGWCEEAGTFRYELTVTVTVSEGVITTVDVVRGVDESEYPEDNDRYLDYAINGREKSGVTYTGIPQQILDQQSADSVDIVSGATYSSEAIAELAARALEQAIISEEEPVEPEPVPDETEPTDTYVDGVYSLTGWCEEEDVFRYELTVTVTVSGGAITAVDVVRGVDESEYPEDNERYLDYAINGREKSGVTYIGIPQQILDRQSADGVDIVSGATYSSETILELAGKLLAQIIAFVGGAE